MSPQRYSPMILQASLAEETSAQYIRSSKVMVSPGRMFCVLPSLRRSYVMAAEGVTGLLGYASPRWIASSANSTVITLVRLAG